MSYKRLLALPRGTRKQREGINGSSIEGQADMEVRLTLRVARAAGNGQPFTAAYGTADGYGRINDMPELTDPATAMLDDHC